tara:strand:- start:86 stop:382 length:297 start_codon:yes stop_codon:yes gene_type:complete
MTSTVYEPKSEMIIIEHLDGIHEVEITRFQILQLMYVLYSDHLQVRGGTPTGFFNRHLSNKRKSKKFWRTFFAPYLEQIFPRDIPENAKQFLETLKNV